MTKGVQDRMLAVARVRDDFHTAVYRSADLDAALALVRDDCALQIFPSGRGAAGIDDLRRFLGEDLMPHLPADLVFRRVSRTFDRWRVAQEDLVSFTHDRELPWLLPGVAPTGRRAEVLAISVATVEDAALISHRTLWDHTALTAQLGIGQVSTTRHLPLG